MLKSGVYVGDAQYQNLQRNQKKSKRDKRKVKKNKKTYIKKSFINSIVNNYYYRSFLPIHTCPKKWWRIKGIYKTTVMGSKVEKEKRLLEDIILLKCAEKAKI